MSEERRAVLSFLEALLHLLRTDDFESLAQLLVADVQQLERLYKVVAEPSVEASFQLQTLQFSLLGEGCGEVSPYYASAIAHKMVKYDERHVADGV